MPSSQSRREAIRAILNDRPVATQAELLRRLAARGIRASQATLSRDMAALRVRRVVGGDGPRYFTDGSGGSLSLDSVRPLVSSIESNGVLVVVRTQASAAGTVARALDEAQLAEVMATLAGDDVVFVAPRRAAAARRAAERLRALFALA